MDPAKFPKEYLGTGATAARPGGGRFEPVRARVAGRQVAYYAFPAPRGVAGDVAALASPLAYVFDPAPPSPFPARPRCQAPAGYAWDQRLEAFRLDEQGNVFTALPSDLGYLPVVVQVPVTSQDLRCQDIKSEETLLQHPGVQAPQVPPSPDVPGAKPRGRPDGTYLAWAVINPAAEVGPVDPETRLGPQRWGWFNHYLLAYLDGGYLPTATAMGMAGPVTTFVPQKLYYPAVVGVKDEMGMVKLMPGARGQGFDVLSAARGEAGYSPLCEVYFYTPQNPEEPYGDARQIETDPMAMPKPDPQAPYVFCLQFQ